MRKTLNPVLDQSDRLAKLELKKTELLILYSTRKRTRAEHKSLHYKLRKHYKGWNGLIVELAAGENIEGMSAAMTEAVYEKLMSKFDPDLHEIRMGRKKEALQKKKAEEMATAHQYADHLQSIAEQAAEEVQKQQLEGLKRIEKAAGK